MRAFRKMKDEIEKAFEEYRAREVDLLNELCEWFRQIGVNGAVHVSESWNVPMGTMRISPILGHVKIEDRNVDLVQVEVKQRRDAEGDVVQCFEYLYYYVVEANVKGLESRLKAEVKPVKKGLLSSEVVDFKWEGGELAQLLNSDSDLRSMLLRIGLDQLPEIEIRPREEGRCVGITRYPRIREYLDVAFGRLQTVGRREFPSREDFEIFDRIAQHISNVAAVQSTRQ